MVTKPKRVSVADIELVGTCGSATGGRRKPLTKSSRRQELRSEVVELRHLPTGREIHIEIPPGHYSKREMQRLREEAKRKFAAILEGKHATGPARSTTPGGVVLRVATRKRSTETLPLRITVVNPPPNISWALQVGRGDLVKPSAGTQGRISFDFSVEVSSGDSPSSFRLRGPAVQGRPGERFVYLCIGAYAGQPGVPGWRAKVSLQGITGTLLDAARRNRSGRLEAELQGTAPDGGPSRASVRLIGAGWRVG